MANWFCSVFNVVCCWLCRKRLSRSELIDSAWIVIVPGQNNTNLKIKVSYFVVVLHESFSISDVVFRTQVGKSLLNWEYVIKVLKYLEEVVNFDSFDDATHPKLE